MQTQLTFDQLIQSGTQALADQQSQVAEDFFRQALLLAKKNFFHNDPRIPEVLSYLGQTLYLQNNIPEAKKTLLQSVSIGKANHCKPLCLGMSLLVLAAIAAGEGNEHGSEGYFEEAKAYCGSEVSSNELERMLARLRQAEEHDASIEEVQEQEDWTELFEEAQSKIQRGASIEDSADAYRLLHRAFEIAKQKLAPNDSELFMLLNKMGILCSTMGLFDRAEQLYLRALAVSNEYMRALVQLNLGHVYANKHNYELADVYLRQALGSLNRADDETRLWIGHALQTLEFNARAWKCESMANVLVDEALAHSAAGSIDDAVSLADEAVTAAVQSPLRNKRLELKLLEIKMEFLLQKNEDVAREQCRQKIDVAKAEVAAASAAVQRLSESLPQPII